MASAFLDLLVGADPAPTAVPYRGDLDALVGEYAGPARGTHAHMEVTRDGDQLVLQPATSSTPLRPTHVGDGVWRDGGSRFWFVTPGGTATELRIAQGAGHYVLRRIGR